MLLLFFIKAIEILFNNSKHDDVIYQQLPDVKPPHIFLFPRMAGNKPYG